MATVNYGGIYNEVKQAIIDKLIVSFNSSPDKVDIYPAPFQNIPIFPAVTVETIGRDKKYVAVGGVHKKDIDFAVWVYTNVLESVEAEEWCLYLTDKVEGFLLSDKTLGGKVTTLSLDEPVQFGQVEQGENNFLQGARIPVKVTTRMLQEGGNCS